VLNNFLPAACISVDTWVDYSFKSYIVKMKKMAVREANPDDGLVVEACGSGYQALPSHPSIRLWKSRDTLLNSILTLILLNIFS